MKDFIFEAAEIISGTNNRTHPLYVEAVKIKEGGDTRKTLYYLKSFLITIANGMKKTNNNSIILSNGIINNYKRYRALKDAVHLLNDFSCHPASALGRMITMLEAHASLYNEGFDRNVYLVMSEYISTVFLIETGIAACLGTVTMENDKTGIKLKCTEKLPGNLEKLIHDFESQLSGKGHQEYLKDLLSLDTPPRSTNAIEPNKEEVKTEAGLMDSATATFNVIKDTMRVMAKLFTGGYQIRRWGGKLYKRLLNNMFGIIPLIRATMYIKYNRKVDKILKLEEDVEFLRRSIEELKYNNKLTEEQKKVIIKKREAYIEQWNKKAAKMRAEFAVITSTASDQLSSDDETIRQEESTKATDEFVLEMGG